MTARLSLTMIVKDEAANLPTCLDSIKGIPDDTVITDTGSSDNTRDIAQQHGARVFDHPWNDSFADARNHALQHAHGEWILWLDADEHLDDVNRDKLRNLLDNLPDQPTAFVLHQRSAAAGGSATLVAQVRLFRNHPDLRWSYRVHEQILPAIRKAKHAVQFTDIAIEHRGYVDPALRRRKLERNLRLLHLDHAEKPADPFTLFNLGWAYADLGRPADAVPILQQSLRHSHPSDSITAKLYALLTQCHRRLGQPEPAWAACCAGVNRCPADAELLFLKGQLCRERGDRAAARSCWTRVLKESAAPASLPSADGVFASVDAGLRGPLVRHHLAALCEEEGRADEAATHWNAALAEEPSFLPARLGLAELHLRSGRWTELAAALMELEQEPAAALGATLLHARAHLARREFAEARRLLEDVNGRMPHLVQPLVLLSHVLLQSGDETAAEPVLRQIVERDPGQAESWRNLAVLHRRRGRMLEAIRTAQAGRLHCPHDADLLLMHGVLLHEGGDAINAETCLLRLLDSDSGNGPARRRRAAAHQHLGAICRGAGRIREAEAHAHAALAEGEMKGE